MPDFVAWGFPATGGNTNRTQPDRLADITNVKDFGAIGDGVTNDTAAINAAILYRMTHPASSPGGVVFFPPGIYKCSNLTVGHATITGPIILRGSGRYCTTLSGTNSTGFLVSKNGLAIDNIEQVDGLSINGGGSGAVQVTGSRVGASKCRFGGMIGFDASGADGCHIRGCTASTGSALSAAACGTVSTGNTNPFPQGSIGIALGKNGVAISCRIDTYHYAFAMSGTGPVCMGCSAERCFEVVRMGWSPAGEVPCIGGVVQSLQTERDMRPVVLYNAESCFVGSCALTGDDGSPNPSAIASMTWSSGTQLVTVTTSGNHNLGSNGTVRTVMLRAPPVPPSFIPAGRSGDWCVRATVTGPTTFTYPGVTVQPAAFSSGNWNLPLEYALRLRKVSNTFISSISFGIKSWAAAVDMDYNGEAVHFNNLTHGLLAWQADPSGGYGWIIPSDNKNLAGWKHYMQSGGANTLVSGTHATPNGFMLFSSLPGQAGAIQPGPFEGQEFDIVDAQTQATFGVAVAGGGSTNHYKVRWSVADNGWLRAG